jgi:hypothetical protein
VRRQARFPASFQLSLVKTSKPTHGTFDVQTKFTAIVSLLSPIVLPPSVIMPAYCRLWSGLKQYDFLVLIPRVAVRQQGSHLDDSPRTLAPSRSAASPDAC